MIHISKNNGPILKGIFYLVLGIVLGLSALGLGHITFMKYLLFGAAGYFIACGFYFSGLYHTVMSHMNMKK
jgi:hypothetical protein